jgi:hypothetical protein
MNTEPQEHPFNWLARKQHKTHFMTSKNASQSLPKLTNTPMLYDGTAEAHKIFTDTLSAFEPQEGLDWKEELTVEGSGILHHALDYLKGKDNPLRGMWSKFFFENEGDLSFEDHIAIQNMVMDRSAVVETEQPKLVQIAPVEKPCEPKTGA